MAECKPCGNRGRKGIYSPGTGTRSGTRKKEWRVFLDSGPTRDYYTEADADLALEKHGPGRKQRLAQ
jgi:hypothetical protein